ncbi:MAG: hypothetical protein ABWY00_09850 [Dongiaceae bacterium]
MSDDDLGSEDLSKTLERAQAAVAALARDYVNWAHADIAACQSYLDQARLAPDQRDRHLQELYGIAHNIKGQGSAFDFPLMTRIGQSLCQLTRYERGAGEDHLDLIARHLQALRQVLDNDLRGDGDAGAQDLAAGLEAAVAAERA